MKLALEAHAIKAIKINIRLINPTLEALPTVAQVESTDGGIAEALQTHPQANTPEFKNALASVDYGVIRTAIIGTPEIPSFLAETNESRAIEQQFCAAWYTTP